MLFGLLVYSCVDPAAASPGLRVLHVLTEDRMCIIEMLLALEREQVREIPVYGVRDLH